MPMREYMRDKVWLLPPSLDELIPADHPVRFVAEFVDQLDLQEIGIDWVAALEGGPSHDRRLLLACWVYGFMSQVRSSRKIETACTENVPFMWLAGTQAPDHSTLSRFHKQNRPCLKGLFKKTVGLAIEMGLVDFAVHAIDGTKMATATLERRVRREKIEELLMKVDGEIAAMERAMAEESCNQGLVRERMPKGLTQKKDLRERMQKALEKLDILDSKKAVVTQKDEQGEEKKGKGPRISVADPEAVVLKSRQGYKLGYNAQAGVDGKARIIVGSGVCAETTDLGQLLPTLEDIEQSAGRLADQTVTDGGYHCGENLDKASSLPTTVFIPDPQEKRKTDAPDKWPYHKDNFVYESATDSFRCPEENC